MAGVQRCGVGRWADIKRLQLPGIAKRSAVDLKDKWRNLVRLAALRGSASRCDLRPHDTDLHARLSVPVQTGMQLLLASNVFILCIGTSAMSGTVHVPREQCRHSTDLHDR